MSGLTQAEQIRLRLTKTQASLIWEGLAFLAREDAIWREGKPVAFQYAQAMGEKKRAAQSKVVEMVAASVRNKSAAVAGGTK